MPNDNLTIPLDELRRRVDYIYNTFMPLLNNPLLYSQLRIDRKSQVVTGINKAFGQAVAYVHEAEAMQSQLAKGRQVIAQVHADVTAGAADSWFAKSTECKSITDAKTGAVDTQIRKALAQIAGLGHGTPREKDVRIIDVRIEAPTNPWPLSETGSYSQPRSVATEQEITQAGLTRIINLLRSREAMAVKDWLKGETRAITHRLGTVSGTGAGTGSTRPIHLVTQQNGQQTGFRTRCLTIKVRYKTAFFLGYDAVRPLVSSYLDEIVFQVYRGNMNMTMNGDNVLTVEVVKVKKRVDDPLDWLMSVDPTQLHLG